MNKIDAIIIAGDIVKPDFKSIDNGGLEYKFAAHKEIVAKIMKSIQEVFPGIPILPVLGDCDNLFYYMVPDVDPLKELLYSSLTDVWFQNVKEFEDYEQMGQLMETFMNGAYYRYNLDEKLTILALNSLYWNWKNPV